MKDRKRAIRRHHRDRLIRNRKNYWGYDGGWFGEMPREVYNVVVNTPCVCSKFCCGNPRRHHKYITRSEYLSGISYKEQCDEVGVGFTLQNIKKFKNYF